MVLPGIQALFGFQMVAIFDTRFAQIPIEHQQAHLAATGLVAIAAALVMTPAAIHRSTRQLSISERFIRTSDRFLLASMVFLMSGIAIDFFVISAMIIHDVIASKALACGLAVVLVFFWFVCPVWYKTRGHHH